MIIQIRGTSGSGKTHLVKQVIAQYDKTQDYFILGRKRPLHTKWYSAKAQKFLTTIGHYEIACGGADTISGFVTIFNLVNEAAARGEDVLFEGLILTGDNKRMITCAQAHPSDHLILSLTTPLNVCLEQIQRRREARGKMEPVNPKNTTQKWNEEIRHRQKFLAAGVNLKIVSSNEAAVELQKVLLGG